MNSSLAKPEAFDQTPVPAAAIGPLRNTALAYRGLVVFTFAYFIRPEDWFPIARFFPLAMIGGAIALAGFLLAFLNNSRLARKKETWILLVLLGWFILEIPLSNWPGGSFKLFKDIFSKIVLMAIVLINVVDTPKKLKTLISIQVAVMTFLAWMSRGHMDAVTGRLTGASQAFGNSNDLASLMAVTIPMAFFLFYTVKNKFARILWIASMGVMTYIIVLTMSRTGFLAVAGAVFALSWHFGLRGKRFALLVMIAGFLFIVGWVVAPSGYGDRVLSIFDSELDSGRIRKDATGSREARKEQLQKSLEVTAKHPIFGVGPGQFAEASGVWRVSHNTFLQFSAESGLPGLLLFLWLVRLGWRNLNQIRQKGAPHTLPWITAGALRASLIAFLTGAFFSNFGYSFFTYFLLGLIASAHQIYVVMDSVGVVQPSSELSDA